jgi:hypothetical protein
MPNVFVHQGRASSCAIWSAATLRARKYTDSTGDALTTKHTCFSRNCVSSDPFQQWRVGLNVPNQPSSFWHPWVSYKVASSGPSNRLVSHAFFQPACLELGILDLLETLHASLHLLRSRIVSALRVLVDVQLVVLSLALVFALHHILSQNLCDGLDMLDGVVGFLRAGLEIPGEVVRVACEFSRSCESCLVACVMYC